MSETVISVENLSKRYIIDHQRNGMDGLRHRLEDALRHPFRRLRSRVSAAGPQSSAFRRPTKEEFWALKDVSFEIKQGDIVGIIGRNGAGKSTLLKVLSRITEPTQGRIRIKGRVASLLEVGTGFHQELTGRENIYLNGAILGMTKAEIRRKFDEIVTFSEVEKFLDTPVKRYSSGMYVRLAFAVAAHLEPEILIVDEVLAVGDAAFQKKCLGRMSQVAHEGRTVLFVSHNMSAVQALCGKAIYLQSGAMEAVGSTNQIIHQYLADTSTAQNRGLSAPIALGRDLKLVSFALDPTCAKSGDKMRFSLGMCAEGPVTIYEVSVLIYSLQNVRVGILDLRFLGMPLDLKAGEEGRIEGEIASLPLVEGEYSVGLYINASSTLENVFDLVGFSITGQPKPNSYAPVPPEYRGLVELDFTAELTAVRNIPSGLVAAET